MIIEPPVPHQCPKCSDDIYLSYMTSCNTFGAKFWTDARIIGDMYGEHEWLVKCDHCGALWWSDDLDKEGGGGSHELKKKDYLLKLKETVLTKKKERYLRIKVWQIGNDKRRKSDKKKELSKKEKKNLKALDKLLDYHDDDNNRILKAEIHRELGKFKDAESLLEKPFDEEFSQTVSTIKELIQTQDPFVAQITE